MMTSNWYTYLSVMIILFHWLKIISVECFIFRNFEVKMRWHKNKQNKQTINKSSKLCQYIYIYFIRFIFLYIFYLIHFILSFSLSLSLSLSLSHTHTHTHTHTYIYIYIYKQELTLNKPLIGHKAATNQLTNQFDFLKVKSVFQPLNLLPNAPYYEKDSILNLVFFFVHLVLGHINHYRLFNVKSFSYIYIIWFGWVLWHINHCTYLMPNLLYIYIYILNI